MAKAKAAPAANVQLLTDSLLASVTQRLGKAKTIGAFNVGVSIANDVGIPFPALCLRYLFQISALPLSRMLQVAGEEGSAKSAFVTEVSRWALENNGLYFLAENENKDTRNMRSSIYGWDPISLSRVIDKPTTSLQEWQRFLTAAMQNAAKAQLLAEGPGRTVPVLFAVDSLMGTSPEEEQLKIATMGAASKGFADAANLIARWLRSTPKMLADFPFLLLATNHAKPGTDAMGHQITNVPGGKGFKFMETFELHLKRVGDIRKKAAQGLRVKLKMVKNSSGPGRCTMEANLLWKMVSDENGQARQYSAWDWHTASIDLLMSFDSEPYKRDAIRDITGIQVKESDRAKQLAYSDILGVPKGEPIPYYQMSQILEERPDVLKELYKVLHISTCPVFQVGKDYLEQRQAASKRVAEVVATGYARRDLLPLMTGDEIEAESGSLEENKDASDE